MSVIGDFHTIVEHLRTGSRFALVYHLQPDGDTVGSCLALQRALERLGKTATVCGDDPVPSYYSYLTGFDRIAKPHDIAGQLDAVLFIDCGDLARAGSGADLAARASLTMNVDHHLTNTVYGTLNYVDTRAAAVGEMVYQLIKALDVPLDHEMAECIYTAITTDTGSFRYENTSVDSHLIAAEVIALHDVIPWVIAQRIFENRSYASLRLAGKAIDSLAVEGEGRIAHISVTQAMLAATGASEEDVEGLIAYPRSLESVDVALRFYETGDGRVKVSLRSKGDTDVSRIAAEFRGGGHPRAAGCTLDGPLDVARDQMLSAVRRAIGLSR